MKQVGIALVLGIVAVSLIVILLGWFAPGQAELRAEKSQIAIQQTRELAPLWLAVKRILIGALGVGGAALALIVLAIGVIAMLSIPNGVRWTWLRSWLVRPTRYGAQYPTLAAPDGNGHIRILDPVNERGAQRVAALTTGLAPDVRLTGSAVRQALLPPKDDNAMLPGSDEAPAAVPVDQVLSFDPKTNPHWLCIGGTGAGKSTAIYSIAASLRQQHPAEFIVLEREAQDWNDQAAAISVPGYLEALERIEAERQRRAALLREADVDHISKLADPPPYLVIILEEAESVYKAMQLVGRSQSVRYMAMVRDLASMGRKQGMILIVATQTGTSDVFDVPTRKNLTNKLFFRNEPAVGDAWGIPREVGLSRLPTGTAYSLNHAALVQFPQQARPRLPLSQLYRERRPEELLLPADATADGLGIHDQPSGIAGTLLELPKPAPNASFAASAAVPVPVPAVPESALRIPSKRIPTPVEARAMRTHYHKTGSKTAVCHAFYGYKNDEVWAWVDQALKGEI